MSFGTSVLSKLRLGEGGMSTLLPLHTSPPSRPSEEHDLAELSPRADDALLSPGFSRDLTPDSSGADYRNNDRISARSKGKGKAIAFAYQDRPVYSNSRTPKSGDDYTFATGGNQKDLKVPPGIWRPKIHTEQRDSGHATTGTPTSLVESIFLGRSSRTDRSSDRIICSEVDNTFKFMQRRERQIHKELQKLLDAQGAALERDLGGGDLREASSESSSKRELSPVSSTSTAQPSLAGGSVVPVRQPKRKPMSKRQARNGIARSVTMLADLKNEEDAYIAAALASRKTALSKLRNLSSQHKSITAEMKALEEDDDLPIRTEILAMEDKHRTVSANIEKLEEKLRALKRAKIDLERRLEEARSTRDSSLSGYRGALKQCDQGIVSLMKYPGIQVLEVEDLKEQGGGDLIALTSKHMSGVEFLSLRPERRTAEMAKDWWEGEVSILELRKAAVDKERTALEEGNEIWQQVLVLLVDFETRLNESLQVATKQHDFESTNPGSILRNQYKELQKTLRELQKLQDYVETRGWNLLIAAIGAELAHFIGLKDFLADVIRSSGYDDGTLTPSTPDGTDLVDVHENDQLVTDAHTQSPEDEELSRSVVRRWDGVDEQQTRGSPPVDLRGGALRSEESDNEVPPGLFSEIRHNESEDESHNDIPDEFLSMHSPPRRDNHLRRESSETDNAVPPDLLAETRRDDDDTVD
ncbi:uncharacterized protein GGS22DRAFT_50735 [Annulohypoxylon maeteangense]|uniref:uncharacterized protein n=1 Tax=Annulohypoxylon maeteangense TaxID=1927788 RepID=UPI0020080F9E|nr:uncharacterized protein GGS22DRAFT_50735 [Annulohypoxylon maeteangense]KAI0882360.1 hypothetical protein GGS22DRAFT_50735 [Annulohypoxylon maeteangense]